MVASVTSSTHERKSKTNIVTKQNRLLLRHNAFSEDVNIMIVMRAMGVASDQEFLALVGSEPTFTPLLAPTMQHCKEELVLTQHGALEYLAGKIKSSSRGSGPGGFTRRTRSKVDEARDILANVVLCHVPVVTFDFQQKVCVLDVCMCVCVGGGLSGVLNAMDLPLPMPGNSLSALASVLCTLTSSGG